jgi:hypothetical protein
MSSSPYFPACAAKLAEINRLAEARLSAQLTLGIAADQRAMTLASFLVATNAAILAVWAITPKGSAALFPLIILLVGLAFSAACAIWSALPVAWDPPGNEPSNWLEDIPGDPMHACHAAMAEYYDDMITWNAERLQANANWVRVAFVAVLMSIVFAALAVLFT